MYYRIEMGRFISNEYGRAQTLFLIPTTFPITHVLPAFRRWDLLRQDTSNNVYYYGPLSFFYYHRGVHIIIHLTSAHSPKLFPLAAFKK